MSKKYRLVRTIPGALDLSGVLDDQGKPIMLSGLGATATVNAATRQHPHVTRYVGAGIAAEEISLVPSQAPATPRTQPLPVSVVVPTPTPPQPSAEPAPVPKTEPEAEPEAASTAESAAKSEPAKSEPTESESEPTESESEPTESEPPPEAETQEVASTMKGSRRSRNK